MASPHGEAPPRFEGGRAVRMTGTRRTSAVPKNGREVQYYLAADRQTSRAMQATIRPGHGGTVRPWLANLFLRCRTGRLRCRRPRFEVPHCTGRPEERRKLCMYCMYCMYVLYVLYCMYCMYCMFCIVCIVPIVCIVLYVLYCANRGVSR